MHYADMNAYIIKAQEHLSYIGTISQLSLNIGEEIRTLNTILLL